MNRKSLIVLAGAMTLAASATFGAPDGAALYKAKCTSCHGADGSGQTPAAKSMKLKMRDLRSAEVQKQTDGELAKLTADGKDKMPAYKGKLTAAEITALVAHMRTLK